MELIEEFPRPPTGSVIPLAPDPDSVDHAVDFWGAQQLLKDNRPSLLPAFADAFNAETEKERQRNARREELRKESGTAYPETVAAKEFVDRIHERPTVIVQKA
jgi:hypothetical protein